jgi:homoserine O-succinyltransferase
MPLVANSGLPSFERLRDEGEDILTSNRARSQDIRELHIGLLNMMPDAALEVTERQFMRLIGGCNRIAQFFIYPFSVPEIKRSDAAQAHVDRYYYQFDQLRDDGLDALIVTGAIPGPVMAEEPFWEPLGQVFEWARSEVTSTLCACLATHAAMEYFHGISRQPLGEKRWGVFPHRVTSAHPLVRNINTRFDVPHSRFNEIYRAQLEDEGVRVLVESDEAGVHLAVSEDGIRFVYFQGHPEYDRNSLFKEYKREVVRYMNGEIDTYPPFPDHYIPADGQDRLAAFRDRVIDADDPISLLNAFPENEVSPMIDDTWGDTGKIVFNNWLGTVYQLTGAERGVPFMPGIDPANPLSLGATSGSRPNNDARD